MPQSKQRGASCLMIWVMLINRPRAGLRQAARRHSRLRLVFVDVVERVCVALGGRRFYRRWFLSPGRFEVRREVVDVKHEQLDGLRIVQLSDVHAGPYLGAGDLADVVAAINALEPDLVVFTGDLIGKQAHEAFYVLEDFAKIEARLGVFGVFGNHDYRGRNEREIASRFGEHGVRFLMNEAVRPCPDLPLVLLGIEDLEEAKDLDIQGARASLGEGDVEVALCHNPHGAAALICANTALVLSGHTHGNQIDLPLIRRFGPGHPGDRRTVEGVALITSRGVGVVGVPLRILARPEIVCVDLAGPKS